MSEAKGPYKWPGPYRSVEGPTVSGEELEGDELADALNLARADGFRCGRESRDAVIEAAKDAVRAVDGWKARLAIEDLEKALAKDGELK